MLLPVSQSILADPSRHRRDQLSRCSASPSLSRRWSADARRWLADGGLWWCFLISGPVGLSLRLR
jgi:hypothetical protein